MYAALSATTVGCLMGLLAPVALARAPLNVSSAAPANFDAVQEDLDKIPDYLEESQCGGWKDRSVAGTIATVKGVPGRNGVWNGAILTGMATREDENSDQNIDNDFQFPGTAIGLTTACNPDQMEIDKKVWRPKAGGKDGEIEEVDVTYPHPKFTDPSCRWRPKEGDSFRNSAPDIPLKELKDYLDPPLDYGELDQEPDNRQSPPNCQNFCTMLNSYQFYDCLETATAVTLDLPPVSYTICNRWGNKYLCSDQEVKDANGACSTNMREKANSIKCVGPACRCQGDGGPNPGNQCVQNPGTKDKESPVYYSYYRFYEGEYSRDVVENDKGTNDIASDKAEVACYGFYNEFDPKKHFTGKDEQTGISKDRRCVINFDTNGTPIAERRDTQIGKGEYGQNSSLPDRDPNNKDNQRTPVGAGRRPGDYDAGRDLWYLKFSGGFSLLSEEVFSKYYKNDLTKVFLNAGAMDTGKMRATEQLDIRRPLAQGSYIRAFDDSGERSVTSWWQTQQTAIASVMHPPIIRLILPSGWAMGIDPEDPYFAELEKKILKPAEKREDRIEIQLNAEDDTLGAALAYLQHSLLLHIVEEPIPAVVPVGTATEFRSKAEAWCTWYMRSENKQDCESAPQEVTTLIETLEQYATDIDQYRLLRGELALYAAKILNIQQSVTKPISKWMVSNIDAYQAFLKKQKEMQEKFGPQWREVQEAYETFGSTTNMPWCMNQRFTLPVYSLLDDWLPARKTNGDRSANGLPVITADADADIVIDLSTVAFMSGSITLPVLDPVQVRVTDFPNPPADNAPHELRDAYPPLPSVNSIRDALKVSADALPKAYTGSINIPPITLKPIDDQKMAEQEQIIKDTKDVIGKMDDRYQKFWKSIGPLKPYDPAKPDPDFDPDKKTSITYKKPRLECEKWDDNTCQHVEMDLRERLMRIASRPLVFLREDYGSKDEARGIGGPCVTQSDVCSPIHPEEGGEKHLWEIFGPKKIKDTLEQVRSAVRNATLPKPVGNIDPNDFPHYGTTTGNLLPIFNIPPPVELFPARSSSSSSSVTP